MRWLSFKGAALAAIAGLLAFSIAWIAGAPTASAATTLLGADLLGSNEVPSNPSGSGGTVTLTVDDGSGQICAYLDSSVEDVTGMHIHNGSAGVNAPIVVGFPYEPHVSCVVADPAVIAAILANPAGHYFNVHTTTFPGGQVRGQLGPVAPTDAVELQAMLNGSNVVAPSTSLATGVAAITVEDDLNRICFNLELEGLDIDDALSIHIHHAIAGLNAPVNVQFMADLAGCGEMNGDLLDQLIADPSSFYFDVHTAVHPGGEIRGQLAAAPVLEPPVLEPPVSPPTLDPAGPSTPPSPGGAPAAQPVRVVPTFTG